MDNKIFNVNGLTREFFDATIRLAFMDPCYVGINRMVEGWKVHKDYGLILLWYVGAMDTVTQRFPTPLPADATAEVAWEWLHSSAAIGIKCEDSDDIVSGDCSNELGWRVYKSHELNTEANAMHYAFAVKPAYLWFSK